MSTQEVRTFVIRSDDARQANERLAHTAEKLHFVSRVPMFCECSEPRCRALVLIHLDRYDEIRQVGGLHLTAPGHRLDGGTAVADEEDYSLYWENGPA